VKIENGSRARDFRRGEYRPSGWAIAGVPLSVFAQYQHTWYADAIFNTPASSPAFNYTFRREDDTVKLGVNLYFNPPPPAEPAQTFPGQGTALEVISAAAVGVKNIR
jgi:hypothetical protein